MSTYIAVRCHALLQKLIPRKKIQEMTQAGKIDELVEKLLGTQYAPYIRERGKQTADSLYTAYKAQFKDRCDLLLKGAGEGLQVFLQHYLQKFDVENLIKILRMKETNRTMQEDQIFPISSSKIPYSKLLQAENLEGIFSLLQGSPYEVKKDVIQLYEEFSSLLPVEGYIWKKFYERAWEAVAKLPDSKKAIKEIVGREIDIRNYFIAVGPPLYQSSKELAEFLFIHPTWKVSLSKLQAVLHSEKPEQFLGEIPYEKVMSLLLEREETKAEIEAYRQTEKWLRERKVGNFVSSLYVLMYLKFCEFEFRDLTKITFGARYNIPSDTLVNHLILPSPPRASSS